MHTSGRKNKHGGRGRFCARLPLPSLRHSVRLQCCSACRGRTPATCGVQHCSYTWPLARPYRHSAAGLFSPHSYHYLPISLRTTPRCATRDALLLPRAAARATYVHCCRSRQLFGRTLDMAPATATPPHAAGFCLHTGRLGMLTAFIGPRCAWFGSGRGRRAFGGVRDFITGELVVLHSLGQDGTFRFATPGRTRIRNTPTFYR